MVFGLFEGGVDVTLNNQNFHFGDTVTGIVQCNLKESKTANALKVHIYGEQSQSQMTSKGMRTTIVRVYEGVVEVAGTQPYYQQVFKFEIALPQNPLSQNPQNNTGVLGFLSSLNSLNKGSIRWYVEAHLDLPNALDMRKKKQINVV